eukprot:365530-Chlamydomonas_euryale.AAC.5
MCVCVPHVPDPHLRVRWPHLPDRRLHVSWPHLPDPRLHVRWPHLPDPHLHVRWPHLPDPRLYVRWPHLPDPHLPARWPHLHIGNIHDVQPRVLEVQCVAAPVDQQHRARGQYAKVADLLRQLVQLVHQEGAAPREHLAATCGLLLGVCAASGCGQRAGGRVAEVAAAVACLRALHHHSVDLALLAVGPNRDDQHAPETLLHLENKQTQDGGHVMHRAQVTVASAQWPRRCARRGSMQARFGHAPSCAAQLVAPGRMRGAASGSSWDCTVLGRGSTLRCNCTFDPDSSKGSTLGDFDTSSASPVMWLSSTLASADNGRHTCRIGRNCKAGGKHTDTSSN